MNLLAHSSMLLMLAEVWDSTVSESAECLCSSCLIRSTIRFETLCGNVESLCSHNASTALSLGNIAYGWLEHGDKSTFQQVTHWKRAVLEEDSKLVLINVHKAGTQ